MPTYQYRREQRVTFEAESDEAALAHIETLDLSSADDESDDDGEIENLDEADMSTPTMVKINENTCEVCGTHFSRASINGGRCLGHDSWGRPCLTMIVGLVG
jgi:hypothetical protein